MLVCCISFPIYVQPFCVLSNLFFFVILFTLGLWVLVPFRRESFTIVAAEHGIEKQLVQRPVLCLLAAALTNEVFEHLFICAKADSNSSRFSILFDTNSCFSLLIRRISLHFLFRDISATLSTDRCMLLWILLALVVAERLYWELSAELAPSLSLAMQSPANSAELEVRKEGGLGGWSLGEILQAFPCGYLEVCAVTWHECFPVYKA